MFDVYIKEFLYSTIFIIISFLILPDLNSLISKNYYKCPNKRGIINNNNHGERVLCTIRG